MSLIHVDYAESRIKNLDQFISLLRRCGFVFAVVMSAENRAPCETVHQVIKEHTQMSARSSVNSVPR